MKEPSPHEIEVIYNSCYGGFSFSEDFVKFVNERSGIEIDEYIYNRDDRDIRSDPEIIALVREFGLEKAAGRAAKLVIQKIPPFYAWKITEYDGLEHIKIRPAWKQLATAFMHDDRNNVLMKAALEGTLAEFDLSKSVYTRLDKLEAENKELRDKLLESECRPPDAGGAAYNRYKDRWYKRLKRSMSF